MMHPYGQMFMVLRAICLVYGVLLGLKFTFLLVRFFMEAGQ